MDIRMYRTADNPRNLQKFYTRDSSLVPGPFSNVDAAVFGPGSELDLSALKIDFEAVQEGSGDPSPDNVRPIVGKTQAVVNLRSGSEYSAVSKSFGGTYYGGTYDAVSGVLTLTEYGETITGSRNISQRASGVFSFLTDYGYKKYRYYIGAPMCDKLKPTNNSGYDNVDNGCINFINNTGNVSANRITFLINDSITTTVEAKAWLNDNPITIVYRLFDSITINIGALTGINFFPGVNRIWASDMVINELAFTEKSGSAAIEKTNGFEVPDAAFISENDRRNPVLRVLSGTNLTDYNYVYISEYDRFYFCEVTNLANGVYLIHCHLDLLMSCKDKIKALNCTVERSASDGSSYLADDQYPVNSYKKYITRLFPHGVDGNSYILMTVGNKIIEE